MRVCVCLYIWNACSCYNECIQEGLKLSDYFISVRNSIDNDLLVMCRPHIDLLWDTLIIRLRHSIIINVQFHFDDINIMGASKKVYTIHMICKITKKILKSIFILYFNETNRFNNINPILNMLMADMMYDDSTNVSGKIQNSTTNITKTTIWYSDFLNATPSTTVNEAKDKTVA